MSESISLFVACHKPNTFVPKHSLLYPIHVGSALTDTVLHGALRDDSGEHISQLNKSYCELTAQYWAWKNVDSDYYGFMHYRRYFNFSNVEYPEHFEPFIFGDVVFDRNDESTLHKLQMNESTMRNVITSHDFISVKPVHNGNETVYENYRGSFSHHIEDFDTVIDIVRRDYPEIWQSAARYIAQPDMYVCNMFIMRKDLFQKYCTFLFDVLEKHAKLCNNQYYSAVGRRVSGYLAERLCGMYMVYLYDQGYNGVDLQRVYFKNTDIDENNERNSQMLRSTSVSSIGSKTDVYQQEYSADTIENSKATTDSSDRNVDRVTQVGQLIRHNGKLYMRVKLPKLPERAYLTVSSRTTNGKELPAKMLSTPKGTVVVLADMNTNQRITWKVHQKPLVTHCNPAIDELHMTTVFPDMAESFHNNLCCDNSRTSYSLQDLRVLQYGRLSQNCIDQDEMSMNLASNNEHNVRKNTNSLTGISYVLQEDPVSRHTASVSGRIVSALRADKMSFIRNLDVDPLLGDTRVHVHEVIDDRGVDIIRGEVHIPVNSKKHMRDYLELHVVNKKGENVALGEWICLGDSVIELDSNSHKLVRTISFSVSVRVNGDIYIWTRTPECNHVDGCLYFNEDDRVVLRNMGLNNTISADKDFIYDAWFRTRHRASQWQLEIQRQTQFKDQPKYSIIVPLYKTPINFFNDMVNSVISQTYRNWELILVNASTEDTALREAVQHVCATDKRIVVVNLPKNLGITLNTNEGITKATGDFVAFLDHDDILEPDALYCYTRAINEHSDTDMLYCDEDKFDNTIYRSVFFKPDWNPRLLLGMNYVCHFLTVRKSVLDTLDLPTADFDGSQDWHMTFRIGEKARYVHHEPKVLYHWRVHQNSTAERADQKSYTQESSRLAIEQHLQRCNIKGTVVAVPRKNKPTRYCIDYDIENNPLVSIIIPNRDALQVLHRCLMSVKKYTTYANYEIIIVENNSTDPELFDYYRKIQQDDSRIRVVTVHGMKEFNFSRLINEGAREAHGEYVVLLNNDTQVITPQWLEYMLGEAQWQDVGIVGAKLLFPDKTIQHAGVMFTSRGPGHLYVHLPSTYPGNYEDALVNSDVAAVTGACLLMPKHVFDEVDGLDEDFAVNYNDIDLCLRVLKAGKRVVYCGRAELYHYESVSRGTTLNIKGEALNKFDRERGFYIERWPETVNAYTAPYNNPNFLFGSPFKKINMEFQPETW